MLVDVLSRGEEGADSEAFYSRICEAVCRLTSMQRAMIFQYDGARRQVLAVGAHGVDLRLFDDAHVNVESAAVTAQALQEDRVIEVTDDVEAQVDDPYKELVRGSRLVCAPMTAAGRWVGVILAARPVDELPMDDAEKHLLWTLGKTAALAAVSRIATSQAEKAQALEQRINLAREVHERVVQRLFGVSLALSADRSLSDEERLRCAAEVQAALTDLRTAVQRPLGRSARPTRTTLAKELTRLSAEHGDLGVVLERGDATDVPPHLEPLAQSVLAEAVRNAHKHSKPTRVGVAVERADGMFVLEVTNDGVKRGAHAAGMGLRLAAFEALECGGIVEFGERDAGTWQVKLVVSDDVG